MTKRLKLRDAEEQEFNVGGFIERIENGLKIDEHKLEDELKWQPEMRHDVGIQLAYAISRRDQIVKDLKILKAEVARDFRSGAVTSNEKYTVAEVNDTVVLDKEVRREEQRLVDAERDVKLLEATRDAVKDRGYSIGRLTDLWLEKYYDRDGIGNSENKLRNRRAEVAKENMREQYREERRNKKPPF